MKNRNYNTRYEYCNERMVDWLANFADGEANKEYPSAKKSDYMSNILDIVSKNKKSSVEAKVEELRSRVGLDLIDSIEKSGNNENDIKEAIASIKPLSLRHKFAISVDNKEKMNQIEQYITHTVQNRNGHIDSFAMLDLINDYLGVDDKWIQENKEDLVQLIDKIKSAYQPQNYKKISPDMLARTDEQRDTKKEPPLFLPNPTQGS